MSDSPSRHIVIDARIRRASTGRYTDRLLEHLQKLDNDNRYTVLLGSGDPWQPYAKNFSTKRCRYKQFSLNPLEQIGFSLLLYRLRPDLVHFTMTQQPLFYFGNIVTTTHDLTMLRFVRRKGAFAPIFWIKRFAYRLLFRHAHRKSKTIIVPSQFVKDDLANYQPSIQQKIVVTYEASEPPISEPSQPVPGVEKPFIFHVGSPFPHKNIQRLIEAFEVLRQNNPKLLLVLAGKKEYYFEQLEDWHKQRSSYRATIYAGFVPDTQLRWLYENAEVYVLPSLSEGFGLPGLEAMAHGCPLVSSNATCLPEIYGDAAQFFDPFDVQDIAKKTGEVISSGDLRNSLKKRGFDQLRHYSWAKTAHETLDIYTTLLKTKP
jgi:glycosyltransferase involved in cell wall biosynthesis